MSLWNSIISLFNSNKLILEKTNHKQLIKLERLLEYNFTDITRLELSLTHRSFFKNSDNRNPANERLEFLGDSILGLVISEKLFEDFPLLREGELTKIKARLVNETTLYNVSKEVGLNEFIKLSPDEEKAGGRERPSIVSDAFEAVIAAVYLDGGMEPARNLILNFIYSRRDDIISDESQRNFKGDFLELTQSRGEGNPRYDVISEDGPDHAKVFNVEVYVGNEKVGHGSGNSKKESEQMAASFALEHHKSQK